MRRYLNVLAEPISPGVEAARISARDGAELADVMARVAKFVRACRYELRAPGDVQRGTLELRVDGHPVARDRTHANGWNFVEHDTAQVELFGEACAAIRDGAKLSARFDCSASYACGTTAARLEVKRPPLLFLLDASASMLACLDPAPQAALQCLTGQIPDWWDSSVGAIAKALVGSASDRLDFALRMFPAPGNDCEPALSAPLGAGQDDSALVLLRSLYSTLPLGRTPLVAGLEEIALDPRALLNAQGPGTLVLLSNGLDSCGELTREQSVQRLSDASSRLASSGFRIHVVRVGADGSDPDSHDANLRAIASGAGIQGAVARPGGPNAGATLAEQLERLTQDVTPCSFRVVGLTSDLDRSKLELYLGGKLVAFDASGEKANGWAWTGDASSEVALYGDACSEFQRSSGPPPIFELSCANRE